MKIQSVVAGIVLLLVVGAGYGNDFRNYDSDADLAESWKYDREMLSIAEDKKNADRDKAVECY